MILNNQAIVICMLFYALRATIHINANKLSDQYQEYPEVLVDTKYIYDIGTSYIVTF